jgi:dTDP-glucose 4,6-dehydratase
MSVNTMANLLVTGGAGFIGANFVHHWLGRHASDRVVVLDVLSYAGNLENLASLQNDARLRFVRGDICETSQVLALLREERIDTVVHFAAQSHVDRSIVAPDEFIRSNVLGTHSLLEATRAAWWHDGRFVDGVRFHHVSTDEVYGTLANGDAAFTELHPYRPNSPYAASKAASDHLVRACFHTYGLPVTTSHCSNNYGPFQFPEKLIPLMVVNALRGQPLPVYGRGENIRDWLHVSDHCSAIEQVLERGRAGETYNFGGNSERRNIDVVQALCGILDALFAQDPALRVAYPECPAAQGLRCESLLRFVTDRPGHDWRYAIDASRAASELDYSPGETLDSGLRQTVRWYLDHAAWWRAVLDGSYRTPGGR